MGYDIALLPRRPDEDWETALEAEEARVVAGDAVALTPAEREARVALLHRVAGRLRPVLGEVETWTSPTEDAAFAAEIDHAATGLQIFLGPDSAGISFPYWDQQDPATFHRTVAAAVRILTEETGYEAYDPQAGDTFDGTVYDEGGLEAVASIRAEDGTDPPLRTPQPRPRRNLYLPIGLVVTAGAVVMLALDNRSFLVWTALVIGLIDVAIGVRRRSDE